MTGDDELRSELEALERAAPTDAAPKREPSTVRARWLRPALVGITAVSAMVAALLLTGQLPNRSTGNSTPSPSAVASVEAQARNGDLILTLSSPKSVWTTDEAIDIVATLSYVGDQDQLDVHGGGGPIVFSLRQLSGGNATLGGGQRLPCLSYPIGPQAPLVWPFMKAGVVGTGPFDRAFFEEPRLLLPPGRWEARAWLHYGIGECDDLNLEVAIEFEVLDRGPVPVPTEPVEPSDDAPASVTGILEGDANLEGGCMWLRDAAGDEWEILWPAGYSAEFHGGIPVIVRGGDVVATEKDLVTVSGQRPPGLGSRCQVGIVFEATEVAVVTVDCVLPASDCDLALGAGIQVLSDQHPNPDLVRVIWGRGLRVWHAELHACWEDGRYILVDVLGPFDAIPPQASDLATSVRESAWDNPPCD